MRYAEIKNFEITNGEGIGVSLFVQGCHKHCKNCFNKSTWDFNGGKEWTKEIEKDFFNLCSNPHITRISFLGGEPLADENIECVNHLVKKAKAIFPHKKIWLYTGYEFEEFEEFHARSLYKKITNDVLNDTFDTFRKYYPTYSYSILHNIDVLVDGEYIDDLKDLRYEYAGSTNQRLIDMPTTLKTGIITPYKTKNNL